MRKNLIKEKRKELRERSRSRARSQPRDADARTNIQDQTSYAERARESRSTTGVRLEPSKELKEMTTIILSVIIYSHYKKSLMPGSFQRNMSEIYKKNGLTEVQFPEQTDVEEINNIYREILKDKADRMEMEGEEEDEEMEEETEQQTETGGAVPKRSREPSKSPIEKDSKKKKEERKTTATLRLPAQEKPPVPPPPMPKRSTARREESEKQREMEKDIERKLQRERLETRPRADSQSSVSSTGSSWSPKSIKEVNIVVYVPYTERYHKMFSRALTDQEKGEIVEALFKGLAKITWDYPQFTKSSLIRALQGKKVSIDNLKFRLVKREEFFDIQEKCVIRKQT